MPLDNNKPRRRRKPPQAHGAGDNQPRGKQRNINTGGGDYSEKGIDKRRRMFIEHSTVAGDVVHHKTEQIINNQASNYGVQAVFHAPVYLRFVRTKCVAFAV
jgi:hypothetical protein